MFDTIKKNFTIVLFCGINSIYKIYQEIPMKVLIVDDSMIMRRAIEGYLKDFDIEIIGTAGDGKTALALFKEKEPDIVTMDITMPEMDGLTCIKEMLAHKKETKIMVVTALSDEGTALEALKLGAAGFLAKPFNEQMLKEKFEKMIGA